MSTIIMIITKFFPLWVILSSIFAFFQPGLFTPHAKSITYILGIIMLGMGLTMSIDDFKLVLKRPKDVFFGIILRYVIMPVIGYTIAKVLGLPPAIAAGLILVGSCPSGTASNVMTFLAKGDTALSVTVSSFNTVLAPILTPYIFLFLAGTLIPIKAEDLLFDILKIVLLPVGIGITLRTFFSTLVEHITPAIPAVSVLCIVWIIASVIALSAGKLATVAVIAFIAVALHNAAGLGIGYLASRTVGMTPEKAKAISFEIGMENSGLAVALAMAHLDPMAAIPGAIFSVWHNFTGSLLAGFWGSKANSKSDKVIISRL